MAKCDTCKANRVCDHNKYGFENCGNYISENVAEVKTVESWLYEIAINNVGCKFDGDFSEACEEIISRLDGLRIYAQEKEIQE